MSAKAFAWFRVALSDDGKLESVRSVEQRRRGGALVFYVSAVGQESAVGLARAMWREYANAEAARNLRERRAANQSEGKCRCGRTRETQVFTHCQRCRERGRLHKDRAELKSKGVSVPKLDRRVVLAERKTDDRLSILLEIQEAWQTCGSNANFTRWLQAEIAKLATKRVA